MNDEERREPTPQEAAASGSVQTLTAVNNQLMARLEQAGVRFGQLQAAAKQQETEFKATIAELEDDIKYLHEQMNQYRDVIAEREGEIYTLRKEHGERCEAQVSWPVDANGSPVEEEMA